MYITGNPLLKNSRHVTLNISYVEGLFWACVELKISTEQFPVCGKPYFLSDIIATVAIVSDEILTAIVGFIYNKMSVKAFPKITESAHT